MDHALVDWEIGENCAARLVDVVFLIVPLRKQPVTLLNHPFVSLSATTWKFLGSVEEAR